MKSIDNNKKSCYNCIKVREHLSNFKADDICFVTSLAILKRKL